MSSNKKPTSQHLDGLTPRQRKRAAKHEALLTGAMAIIVEQGIDGLTIGKLAKSLDLGVGGIYRYFDSKQAILLALQRRALETLQTNIQQDLKKADAFLSAAGTGPKTSSVAPLFRILLIATAVLNDALQSPERHALIRAVSAHNGQQERSLEQALQLERALQPIFLQLRLALDDAARADALGVGDAMQRASLIWTALMGLDCMRDRDRVAVADNLTFKPLCRQLFRTLLQGWGASTSDIDEAFGLLRFNHKWRVAFF